MGPDLIVWTMVFRNYDDLFVGDRYPKDPPVFDVSQEVVDRFRVATLGAGAVLAEGAGLAPTMLAGVYTRSAIAALKGPPGGVHAKQRFRFVRPVRVGDRLTTTLEIREKYAKNGRNYVVSRLETRAADGELVTEGQVTAIWGKDA